MPSRTLPGLDLTAFYDLGESGWNTGVDENFRVLSFIGGGSVVSRRTTLPLTGVLGDVYIVPVGEVNANSIAVWDGPTGLQDWVYYPPNPGWRFFVRDTGVDVQWDGTAWVSETKEHRVFRPGTLTASELIYLTVFTQDVVLETLGASTAYANTAAAAAVQLDIQQNGSSVGTVDFPLGANTGVFAIPADVSIVAGDRLSLVGPAVPDGALADIAVTFSFSLAS